MSEIHQPMESINDAQFAQSPEVPEHSNRFAACKKIIGRAALVLGIASGTFAADQVSDPAESSAAVVFENDYPNLNAQPFNAATYDWWVDENGNGKPDVTASVTDDDETMSARGYNYRNCTDGASYWLTKYTGYNPRGWGNANTWDTAAQSAGLTVKPGAGNTIEPGDIAQSDDGTYGHVGFVVSVQKDSAGNVTSIQTAELNKAGTGQYTGPSDNTYSTKNSAGKFTRGTNSDWDSFIDVNGIGKGLNNEPIPSGSTQADTDKDGIADSADYCPFIPGVAANNGCPPDKPNLFADINGDSKTDMVHIWEGGVNTWVSNGDGTYSVKNPYKPSAGYNMMASTDWRVGDMNGDGKTDLLHLWNGGVNTWVSNGDGTYRVSNPSIPPNYSMNGGLTWEVGDFNGDRKADIAHIWNGGVNTWVSNGDGTYSVKNPYKPANYSMTGGIGWKQGDFTGDGKTDLAHLWNGGVNVWASRGDGTYIVTNPTKPANYSMNTGIDWKTGDFNGDAKTDIAHIWNGGVNTWLSYGNGLFTVTNPNKPANYSMESGMDYKIGDFNGDRKADIAHIWNGGVNTWVSNGDGTYSVKNPYKPSAGYNMQGGLFVPGY